MKLKKITGPILTILGIILFIFGSIISGKVKEGEKQIHKAKEGIHLLKDVTKISPYTRKAEKVTTQPLEGKVKEGEQKAATFKLLSIWFRIGGIILFVSGLTCFFLDFKLKKK